MKTYRVLSLLCFVAFLHTCVLCFRWAPHGAFALSHRKLALAAEQNTPPHRESVPTVIPTVGTGVEQNDVFSRLLQNRTLLLGSEVTDEVANVLVSQMLYLATTDSTKDIKLYINSPGGSVQAGLAIFDAMQFLPCDVETICFGTAASMGAFLLAAGTRGKRRSLPNARIMIHQPLGGSQGDTQDVSIAARMILHTRDVLNTYLSAFCDQPISKLEADTQRDFYLTPAEAREYGLIDEVIEHSRMIDKPRIPDLHVTPPLPVYDSSSFCSS